jgi:hypothetical protein
MSNTFKVAGVSKFKGGCKVRFANDLTRVKLLIKAGNTDVNLIELPKAMSKAAAVTFLKGSDLYKVPAQAAAIDAANEKYNAVATVKVTKNKAPKAAKKPAKTPVTMAAIKARAPKAKAEVKPAAVNATPTEASVEATPVAAENA